MSRLDVACDHMRGLLSDVRDAKEPRIASLSAAEAQSIRLELLKKVGTLIDELYAVRSAQHLAEEGQLHVYRALTSLLRLNAMILGEASLDEIQGILETADAELSQAQSSKRGG